MSIGQGADVNIETYPLSFTFTLQVLFIFEIRKQYTHKQRPNKDRDNLYTLTFVIIFGREERERERGESRNFITENHF